MKNEVGTEANSGAQPARLPAAKDKPTELPPPVHSGIGGRIFDQEIKKTSDYRVDQYAEKYSELVKRCMEKSQYGSDFIKENIKGDKGFEKYCIEQLDKFINPRTSALSKGNEDLREEARMLSLVLKAREEISPIVKGSVLSESRKIIFDKLLPKKEQIEKAITVEELDLQLRYLNCAAYVSEGKNEMQHVQSKCRSIVLKLNSFSDETIKQYLGKLEKEIFKNRKDDQFTMSENVAGAYIQERNDFPAVFGSIYELRQHFIVNKEKDDYFTADFVTAKGEKWRLGITEYNGDGVLYLRNTQTGAFASLESTKLINLLLLDRNSLNTIAKEKLPELGKANLEKFLDKVSKEHELEGDAVYRQRLLDKDLNSGKTAFFALYPKENDIIITSSLLASALKERALGQRYKVEVGKENYIFSDDPLKEMENTIDGIVKNNKNIREIFIDLNQHGSEKDLRFKNPIRADQLVELFSQEKYKGIHFDISTLACFNGGLKEGFVKSQKKNISVFMQTAEYVPNIVTSVDMHPAVKRYEFRLENNGKAIYSSNIRKTHPAYSEVLLLNNLMNPEIKTFGEAINRADLDTRKAFYLNPQAIINGVIQTGSKEEEAQRSKVIRADRQESN